MGIETTKALQARRREVDAFLDRLVAEAEQRRAASSPRQIRIDETTRLVRRHIAALAKAQARLRETEAAIGQGLLRLTEQGLSRNQAFAAVGLRRHAGRAYLTRALNAQGRPPSDLSTAAAVGRARPGAGRDRGQVDTSTAVGTAEGT